MTVGVSREMVSVQDDTRYEDVGPKHKGDSRMLKKENIYAAGSETRPPMLNKKNYVPWSSRLLRYAKSRPTRKLIYNSIINDPYVRRMIPEPGDQNREVP
nr:ribonuclease H-like domain-containing protein [Tanacetum cinerariifolium]